MSDEEYDIRAQKLYKVVSGLPKNEGIGLLECVKLAIWYME